MVADTFKELNKLCEKVIGENKDLRAKIDMLTKENDKLSRLVTYLKTYDIYHSYEITDEIVDRMNEEGGVVIDSKNNEIPIYAPTDYCSIERMGTTEFIHIEGIHGCWETPKFRPNISGKPWFLVKRKRDGERLHEN